MSMIESLSCSQHLLLADLDDTFLQDVPVDFLEEWKTINGGVVDDSDVEVVEEVEEVQPESEPAPPSSSSACASSSIQRHPQYIGPETQADILSLGAEHLPKRRRLNRKQSWLPPENSASESQEDPPDTAGQPKSEPLPRAICKSRASKAAEVLGVSTADIKFLVAVQAPLILWQCLFFHEDDVGPGMPGSPLLGRLCWCRPRVRTVGPG